MSPEKMFNEDIIESSEDKIKPQKRNVLRSIIGGIALASATLAPLPSEAQPYDNQSLENGGTNYSVSKEEFYRQQAEYYKDEVREINNGLHFRYPEAEFRFKTTMKCMNSFGGDVFYKGKVIGHVENNCGREGATVATEQSLKMLENYISRVEGKVFIHTTPEIEEKLKDLNITIEGLKIHLYENREGRKVWSDFKFDSNSKSVDILNSKSHDKGVSIIIKNKDDSIDTIEMYPDVSGKAVVVEGL